MVSDRQRSIVGRRSPGTFPILSSDTRSPSGAQLSYPPQGFAMEQSSKGGERVVVCIDGSNLFYAATTLGLEIDYCKLLQQVTAGRSLLRAYFYTGVDPKNEKQQGFLLWMRRHGFRVVTRDLVSLPSGEKSANLDVEMAIDMVQLANHCDRIILFSGDGDLAYAVEQASYKGVRFEVVSLRSMTSEALLNVADEYTDLADLAPYICRSPSSARKPALAASAFSFNRAIA